MASNWRVRTSVKLFAIKQRGHTLLYRSTAASYMSMKRILSRQSSNEPNKHQIYSRIIENVLSLDQKPPWTVTFRKSKQKQIYRKEPKRQIWVILKCCSANLTPKQKRDSIRRNYLITFALKGLSLQVKRPLSLLKQISNQPDAVYLH